MKTLNLGIVIDQGTDFNLVIGIFGINGAIDITGYEFVGQMKTSTDPDAEIVAEFDFKIMNQYYNMGLLNWSLSAETTTNILTSTSGSLQKNRLTTPFVFDIKMKDTADIITRIVQGIVYVSPDATQELFE